MKRKLQFHGNIITIYYKSEKRRKEHAKDDAVLRAPVTPVNLGQSLQQPGVDLDVSRRTARLLLVLNPVLFWIHHLPYCLLAVAYISRDLLLIPSPAIARCLLASAVLLNVVNPLLFAAKHVWLDAYTNKVIQCMSPDNSGSRRINIGNST